MADPAPEFDTAINTTTPATVPDNACARLMYYLNSICTVIELKDEPNLTRLRDYKNWKSLSLDEKSELVKLCEILHPRDLRDRRRVFSARKPIKDSTNEFLTVSSKELGTDIKIMIYEDQWLKRNYSEPLKRMKQEIRDAESPNPWGINSGLAAAATDIVRRVTEHEDLEFDGGNVVRTAATATVAAAGLLAVGVAAPIAAPFAVAAGVWKWMTK